MIPEDVRKLLGGYATGTLTAAEQEALLAAALEDQELFDALMKEEAVRDVLQDPVSKAALLAALEQPPARPAWWHWRPLIGAVAMAGIALGAVAVWRATREKAAPVTVAQEMKQPAPPPVMTAPLARDLKIEPPAPSKPVAKARVASESKKVSPESRREVDKVAEATSKDGASGIAGAAPSAAPVAPPPVQQRVQVQAAAPPAPMAQQQISQSAPSISAEAVQALNGSGAGAVSGFRAASPPRFEIAAAKVTDKKAGPLVQWSLLRGDRDSPPDTVLDAGEAIRLRIVAFASGVVTVNEGDKVLASATVEAGRAFDTPPIPSTGPGPRLLLLTLTMSSSKAPPTVLPITVNYTK
jgi:hypothetical protein